jgi:phosphorylcholine metabolism protein LicD
MNIEVAQENLRLLKLAFDRQGIKFWLSWGTCLGAVRDGKLLAHDNDSDVDVHIDDRKHVIKSLPKLKALGFELLSPRIASPSKTIRIERQGVAIDIFLMKPIRKNGKIIAWKASSDVIEEDFFTSLKSIEFLGESFNVPERVEDYLEYAYGINWRQPIHDFWNLENQLDLSSKGSQREIHSENLKTLKTVLDAHKVRFWLSKDTCLDVVAQRSSNCALRVVVCTDLEEKSKILGLIPELYKLGFEPFAASSLKNYRVVLIRNGEKIMLEVLKKPVFLARLKGYKCYCDRIQFYDDFFTRLDFVNYLNDRYPIPSNVTKYLDYLYGSGCWRDPKYNPSEPVSNLKILAENVQSKSVRISIIETWFSDRYKEFPKTFHVLTRYLERMVVEKISASIQDGVIVLIEDNGVLSVKRVVSTNSLGQVLLASDFPGSESRWLPKSNVVGQVTHLITPFGFPIPLPASVIRILPLGKRSKH